MKHRIVMIGASATFLLAFISGCSSSEETAKDGKDGGGEFTATDKPEVVIPATDQPGQDAGEATRTERPATSATITAQPVTSPVTAHDVTPPKPDPQKTGMMMWAVQIGAFKSEAGAVALINEARTKFNVPVYKDYDAVTGFYKVTVGSFPTREQATQFKEEVLAKGYTGAFSAEVRR